MNLHYYLIRGLNKIFKFNAIKNSSIDKKAKLGFHIQITDSSVGRYSYIGENSCVCNTKIGSFCSISDGCEIGGPAHAIEMVSTSPVFINGKNIFNKNFSNFEFQEYINTIIGNDVWIGCKCLIKAGVTIGDGAVIGMGSIVTHDVPPYAVVAGNPAKIIRYRFNEDIREKLVKLKWWDCSESHLKEYSKYFNDPEELIRESTIV